MYCMFCSYKAFQINDYCHVHDWLVVITCCEPLSLSITEPATPVQDVSSEGKGTERSLSVRLPSLVSMPARCSGGLLARAEVD